MRAYIDIITVSTARSMLSRSGVWIILPLAIMLNSPSTPLRWGAGGLSHYLLFTFIPMQASIIFVHSWLIIGCSLFLSGIALYIVFRLVKSGLARARAFDDFVKRRISYEDYTKIINKYI